MSKRTRLIFPCPGGLQVFSNLSWRVSELPGAIRHVPVDLGMLCSKILLCRVVFITYKISPDLRRISRNSPSRNTLKHFTTQPRFLPKKPITYSHRSAAQACSQISIYDPLLPALNPKHWKCLFVLCSRSEIFLGSTEGLRFFHFGFDLFCGLESLDSRMASYSLAIQQCELRKMVFVRNCTLHS
jgi:hypothetical protein